ncbi:hypothetical protein [Rhodococcus erythropolis]|nr:hypothetical protein [Rhodococcus erythropolis]OFV73520.1 hypothetical protein RERY_58460 [Rhodococcus erythropolis]
MGIGGVLVAERASELVDRSDALVPVSATDAAGMTASEAFRRGTVGR